jgi:hypothetical protein
MAISSLDAPRGTRIQRVARDAHTVKKQNLITLTLQSHKSSSSPGAPAAFARVHDAQGHRKAAVG